MPRLISCQGEKFRTLFATDGNLTVHCKKLENAPYPGQMYVQHVRKNSLTSRKSCGIFIETITSVYFRFAACTFENIRSSKVFIYGRNDKKRRLKYRRRWESKAEKRRSVFLSWETLAISVHCSKSQRSYLEFARMFAEDIYTYHFHENQMNTIQCVFANSIIERMRSRA